MFQSLFTNIFQTVDQQVSSVNSSFWRLISAFQLYDKCYQFSEMQGPGSLSTQQNPVEIWLRILGQFLQNGILKRVRAHETAL